MMKKYNLINYNIEYFDSTLHRTVYSLLYSWFAIEKGNSYAEHQ